jgi:hypothetical protein
MLVLTEENYNLYAAQYYMNSSCENEEEFHEDLNRLKYIKKLLYVYEHKKELNMNLILNHIIILYNVFEPKACTKILFFKLTAYWPQLKSILYYT